LRRLQEELAVCFIYATSDPMESLTLGAGIAVLHGNTICEIGEPQSLYLNPHHLATIDILGFPRANLLDGQLVKKSSEVWCRTNLFDFPLEVDADVGAPGDSMAVTLAIRPEKIQKISDAAATSLTAEIYLREDLGAEEIIYLNIQDSSLTMVNPSSKNGQYDVGDRIGIWMNPASIFVFDKDTGIRIGKGVNNFNA
jgi:ABC-type sugar transport system ATPase subunit